MDRSAVSIFVLIAAVSLMLAACSGGRAGTGSKQYQNYVLADAGVVQIWESLSDIRESNLHSSVFESEFEYPQMWLDGSYGDSYQLPVSPEEVEAVVQVGPSYSIFWGEIDFDKFKDALGTQGYTDSYRGFGVWRGGFRNVAVSKNGGFYMIGGDSVTNVITALDQGSGTLSKDDSAPLKRLLDKVGLGWYVAALEGCHLRGIEVVQSECQGIAYAYSLNGDGEFEARIVMLFDDERVAASETRAVAAFYDEYYTFREKEIEALHTSLLRFNRSPLPEGQKAVYDIEGMEADGEFVIIKVSGHVQ